MDRRKFIKLANKGLAGTVVSVGLATMVKAQDTEEYPIRYISNPEEGTNGYKVYIDIYKSGVKDFAQADEQKKLMRLLIDEYEKVENGEVKAKTTTFLYNLTKVEPAEAENEFMVEAEYKGRQEGEGELPQNFPASPIKMKVDVAVLLFVQNSIVIYDPEGNAFRVCLTPKQAGGCFITSACTESKGLPDDCWELQTMRSLRDNYMMKSPEGAQLIEEYYQIAPNMVAKIDNQHNSKDAYGFIYDTLIIPATKLHAEGKSLAAMNYYRDYVWEMKKLF